jgi:hypothetical protein
MAINKGGAVMTNPVRRVFLPLLLLIGAMLLAARPAEAIPAFAQQTGQPCTACHIGAFGPQLTPTGRAFKITGYTQGGGDGLASKIPVSLMAITTFTNTNSSLPAGQVPQHYGSNNNPSLDQISLFVGGGIGEHVGGLTQFTWTDVDNTFHVDNADLRPYVTTLTVGGKDLVVGATVNNNPTVQDPYNATPAWGYPYILSALAPTPAANVMLSGSFAANSVGTTVYAQYDGKLYLEGGVYNTLSPWTLQRFGNDYSIGSTTDPAPYLRAAYEWQWGTSAAHVGAMFMHADVHPGTGLPYQTTGLNGGDHYTDYSADAGYQFLGDGTHIATVQANYTYESQNLGATSSGTGYGAKYNLNQIRANASYWYQNTYGATLGWQKTWGPTNPVLYAQSELTGSANNKPNSNAFIFEADWVPFGKDDSLWAPFMNMKLGLQYTLYTQFNGGGTNYDGAGRNAGDNNTLLAFAWWMF